MDSINQEIFQNNQLQVDALPDYEDINLERLAPAYLTKRHIATTIALFVFCAALAVVYVAVEEVRPFWPFALAVVVLFFAWQYFLNYQLYKRNGYAVRERDLVYKRGFLFTKTTIVPFNRVQHVSTNRGVLDKMLKLSTLKIFTAGGSGSDISISGLLPQKANSLKEALAERIAAHV